MQKALILIIISFVLIGGGLALQNNHTLAQECDPNVPPECCLNGEDVCPQESQPEAQECDPNVPPECCLNGEDVCPQESQPEDEFVCPDPGPAPSCGASGEYNCFAEFVRRCEGNECAAKLTRAVKSYTCISNSTPVQTIDGRGCTVWNCESETPDIVGGPHYAVRSSNACGNYQVCNAGPPDEKGWSEFAECECAGGCYPAPELKTLQDDTLSPLNVFDDSNNPKLPVNLGWEDNTETEIQIDECTVGSYKYEVTENGETVTGVESENLESIVESCTLLLDKEYKWKVQACLDDNGEDCGEWSEKGGFQSSTALELKLPFDIDFQGEENAQVSIPAMLEWCEKQGIDSYRLVVRESDSGQEVINEGYGVATTIYDDKVEFNVLQKGIEYLWEAATCSNNNIDDCDFFSQLWSFIPGTFTLRTPQLQRPPYNPNLPNKEPAVNLSNSLSWIGSPYAYGYLIRIQGESLGTKDFFRTNASLPLKNIWKASLDFNTSYGWKAASCTGPLKEQCEKNDDGTIAFSEEWRFTTTGAPPTRLQETPSQGGRTAIPATLNWNDTPGAALYVYEISKDSSFTNLIAKGITEKETSQAQLKYENTINGTPVLAHQNTTYWWRVKTCADTEGKVCNGWSQATLTTASLTPPQIPAGEEKHTPSDQLSWNNVFGANFYQYKVTYTSLGPKEISSFCGDSIGNVIAERITANTSASVPLQCTGTFHIQLQACMDANCQETGPQSTLQPFTVTELPIPSGIYGLVPCGVSVNNPNTPWDERESCGFGHIVLLVRNLVDFALWKLSIIIAVLLTIATSVVIFFSFGGPNLLIQIKSMWKAVGVGVLILLFAWTLLNLLLGVLGFNVNIFGNWYEIVI